MVLKDDRITDSNTANVFVWLHMARSNFLWGLTICIVLHIHFGKADSESVYRRPQTLKPWPHMMLESYILPNICPCYIGLHVSMNYAEKVMELLISLPWQHV